MKIAEIDVAVSAFGEALGAMRAWLDEKKTGPVKFETESGVPGTIRVRLEFGEADLAAAFEQQFGDPRLARAA
jgi:hypothetical protein